MRTSKTASVRGSLTMGRDRKGEKQQAMPVGASLCTEKGLMYYSRRPTLAGGPTLN
jgi:hypothetical protein